MKANTESLEAGVHMIHLMTANISNLKPRDATKNKSIVNARNRTYQTHCRATLIHPKKVIIKARDEIRRRALGKKTQ